MKEMSETMIICDKVKRQELTKLCEFDCEEAVIYENMVYYIEKRTVYFYRLCKMNLDGTGITHLTDWLHELDCLNVINGYIYYRVFHFYHSQCEKIEYFRMTIDGNLLREFECISLENIDAAATMIHEIYPNIDVLSLTDDKLSDLIWTIPHIVKIREIPSEELKDILFSIKCSLTRLIEGDSDYNTDQGGADEGGA